MVEPGPEFDETGDEKDSGPLLPPDDRLWRHPSEVGFKRPASADDTRAARERWLTSTPSRAGAWSAGVVGAMLATGVVLMGSHMTTWLTKPGDPSGAAPKSIRVTTATHGVPVASAGVLARMQATVAASLVVVRTMKTGGAVSAGGGVVVSASGMILVPASLVTNAESIEVQTSDEEVFPARLVGTDPVTGVAVVSINPEGLDLHALRAAPTYSLTSGAWTAIEWAQSSRATLFVGAVRSVTAVSAGPGMPSVEDSVATDSALSGHLTGAVILDGTGALVGFVNGREGRRLIELPGPLAEQVAYEITRYGHVLHGTLGVIGISAGALLATSEGTRAETTLTSLPISGPRGNGVKLVAVIPRSAGWTSGLRRGDVIEAVNGQPVTSMSALQRDLYGIRPDTPFHLTVERGTRTFTCHTELRAS